MKINTFFGLFLVLLAAIFLRVHIINNILINNFLTEPLLYTDLLGKGITVPWRVIFLLDLCNIFLFFLIAKKLSDNRFGLLSSLLYGISPWAAYIQLFGSLNIFLLFFFLVFFYGILILKKHKIGFLITIISSIILLYCSLFSWLIIPCLLFGIYKNNLIRRSYLKNYIFIIFIAFIPILILSFKNPIGLKNVYRNQTGILLEPGIKNSINAFQGESKNSGYSIFAKWSENKYIYSLKYLLLKVFKNMVPSTYFTPQEKIFNFSFSPPIYVGLLIPFLYAIYFMVRTKALALNAYLFLMVPSILSKQLADLDRLIIFSPVIIFIISYGLIKLFEKRKKNVYALFLYLTIFLVVFQIIVTFLDIQFREPIRYKLSIGQDVYLNKQ